MPKFYRQEKASFQDLGLRGSGLRLQDRPLRRAAGVPPAATMRQRLRVRQHASEVAVDLRDREADSGITIGRDDSVIERHRIQL